MRGIDLLLGHDAPASERSRRAAFNWWMIWTTWLPLFIPVAVGFVQARPPAARLLVSFAGAAIFFALYLRTNWRTAVRLVSPMPQSPLSGTQVWLPISVMLALSVLLTTWNGTTWGALVIYTAACAGGWLPWRAAAVVIAALTAFTLLGVGIQAGFGAALSQAVFVAIPGVTVVAVAQSVKTVQRLRAERVELARVAAVSEERLRFARDLHDLLGHTLSLIALKSELAGRLVTVAPERAVAEIADVEAAARQALQEVREAVAGYRRASLAGELDAAQQILEAAGIALRQVGEIPPMPEDVEAALSWAVREGVTNVIRHSRAQGCTITLARRGDRLELEVRDDGRAEAGLWGRKRTADGRLGSGLNGLEERVYALGGGVEAGPLPEGGFRLAVAVPVRAAGALDAALVARPVEDERAEA